MVKWLTLIILTISILFYITSYSYGSLYYIKPLSDSDFSIVETINSNEDYFFVDPYYSVFETKKTEYTLNMKSTVHSYPELYVEAKDVEGKILELGNLSIGFQAECVSFSNGKDLYENIITVLSFSRCSDTFKSSFNELLMDADSDEPEIKFNIIDEQGKVLGTERIEFKVYQNGYYMILDAL